MATCGPLATLFPHSDAGRIDEPGALAVQSLPTILVLLAWIGIEASRARTPFTRAARLQGVFLGLLATVALGLLAWRVFDVLECEDRDEMEQWRMLAVVGAPLTGIAILVVGARCVRLGIVASLALAAGTVVADWAMRESLRGTEAATPLAAVQHLWLLLTVVLLSHIPPPRAARTASKWDPSSAGLTLDPLARRQPPCDDTRGSDRSWSWFVV